MFKATTQYRALFCYGRVVLSIMLSNNNRNDPRGTRSSCYIAFSKYTRIEKLVALCVLHPFKNHPNKRAPKKVIDIKYMS